MSRPLAHMVMWLLIHTLLGLAPLWLYYLGYCLSFTPNFRPERPIMEGIIFFFCATMSTVVALDFYFSSQTDKLDKILGLVIILVPCLIFVLSVFLFGKLYFEENFFEKNKSQIETYIIIEIGTLILTAFYAGFLKMLLFSGEEKPIEASK